MGSDLEPLRLRNRTTNELFLHAADRERLLVKVYTGPNAQQRCNTEHRLLRYWAAHGYAVPTLHERRFDALTQPYLVMSWLEGHSLRDFLCDVSVDVGERLKTTSEVLAANNRRHQQALQANDPLLIRYDANSANFFLTANGIYQLDFENEPERRPVVESAAIEIAKLTRWMARDLGRDHLDAVLERVVRSYGGQRFLLEKIMERTRSRPLQFLHRWRDARRKQRAPDDITKYDIADGLARHLEQQSRPQPKCQIPAA